MDGYIKNAVFNGDDGAARDNLVKADGSIGWIVYSKIASLSETDAVSKKNITIAALGEENSDGATATSHIKGFGGYFCSCFGGRKAIWIYRCRSGYYKGAYKRTN